MSVLAEPMETDQFRKIIAGWTSGGNTEEVIDQLGSMFGAEVAVLVSGLVQRLLMKG